MDVGNQVANEIGLSFYYSLVRTFSVALAYGLYVPIAIHTMGFIWRRIADTEFDRTKWLLTLLALIFFSTSAWFSIVIIEQFLALRFVWHPATGDTASLDDRMQVENINLKRLFSFAPFFQGINFVTGDAIVVWRALLLWPDSKCLRLLFCFLLFASGVVAFADAINTVVLNMRAAVDGWQRLDSSSMLLSLFVNATATSLIIFKIWDIRQAWPKNLWNQSIVYRILISLVECGFAFCAVQGINAAVSMCNKNNPPKPLSSLRIFVQSFAVMSPIIAGAYPSIVLLIVRYKSSIDGTLDVFTLGTNTSTTATDRNEGRATEEGLPRTLQHTHMRHTISTIRFAEST